MGVPVRMRRCLAAICLQACTHHTQRSGGCVAATGHSGSNLLRVPAINSQPAHRHHCQIGIECSADGLSLRSHSHVDGLEELPAYLGNSALGASDDVPLIQDQIVPMALLQDVDVGPQGLIAHDQHIMAS